MFDLADVFELIVDSFYEASLPQHQLVAHAHELVLHVVAYGGDELNALIEKLAGELSRDISLVSVELAKQITRHPRNRNTVVHIAWRYLEGEHFSELIDDKVKLEAVEPTFGGFSPLGNTLEDFVPVDSFRAAYLYGGAVHKGNSRDLSLEGERVGHQREEYSRHPLDEAIIARQSRKEGSETCEMSEVEVLECAEIGLMEGNNDGHHFGS